MANVNAADRRIVLSTHALERAETRLVGVPAPRLATFVAGDVRAALRAGRCARRLPGGMSLDGRRRKLQLHDGVRIAWSEDEQRAYVLRPERDRHGRLWLVVTVLVTRYPKVMPSEPDRYASLTTSHTEPAGPRFRPEEASA